MFDGSLTKVQKLHIHLWGYKNITNFTLTLMKEQFCFHDCLYCLDSNSCDGYWLLSSIRFLLFFLGIVSVSKWLVRYQLWQIPSPNFAFRIFLEAPLFPKRLISFGGL